MEHRRKGRGEKRGAEERKGRGEKREAEVGEGEKLGAQRSVQDREGACSGEEGKWRALRCGEAEQCRLGECMCELGGVFCLCVKVCLQYGTFEHGA